jgi:hypothetical protein
MENLAAAAGGVESAAPKSIEDEIRAIHAELQAEKPPETFELPGYGKRLQVKYRVLSSDEQDEIGKKIAEQVAAEQITEPLFMGYIDNLIAACVGFYFEEDGELRPLEERPGYEGGPVRWGDERLARFVGLAEPDTMRARHIVRGVLADDRLVLEHGQAVTTWMTRALRKIQADF